MVIVHSCTIQKRLHLPGYHIEWNNVKDARVGTPMSGVSENQTSTAGCRTEKSATDNAVESVSENRVISSAELTELTPELPKPYSRPGSLAEKNVESRTRKKLAFPREMHAPARLLFGGLQPDEGKRTDGLSIAAMVCGILSFFVPVLGIVLAILAIVFGGIGIGRTNRDPDLRGRGMAITGLVLGILGMLFVLLVLTILSLSFGFAI